MNLVKYENAKAALAELVAVEDVKEFRDKASAVEMYARLAKDYDMERDAAIARVRAERKCGELLRDMEKSVGGVSPKVVPIQEPEEKPKTLTEMGITRVQSSKWQKLANISETIFDDVIQDRATKVSLAHILKLAKPKTNPAQAVDLTANWLFGRLYAMDRKNITARPLTEHIAGMPEDVRQDADRIVLKLTKWLNEYSPVSNQVPQSTGDSQMVSKKVREKFNLANQAEMITPGECVVCGSAAKPETARTCSSRCVGLLAANSQSIELARKAFDKLQYEAKASNSFLLGKPR